MLSSDLDKLSNNNRNCVFIEIEERKNKQKMVARNGATTISRTAFSITPINTTEFSIMILSILVKMSLTE